MQQKEIIYGRHPVVDAIQASVSLERVYIQKGLRGEIEVELRHLTKSRNIPFLVVPRERLQKFTQANHQGVVALRSPVQYYRLADVLPLIYEKGEVPLFLLLDGITDVRNVGAIARSAELCGVHALVLPNKGGALINADALKTSAGALSRLSVCREPSLLTATRLLIDSGVQVLAGSLKASEYLHHIDLTAPTAFVLGSEGDGISTPIARSASKLFKIPQVGESDSFNVSVAAGIMLYEGMRQRLPK